jgi:hypothetical protein
MKLKKYWKTSKRENKGEDLWKKTLNSIIKGKKNKLNKNSIQTEMSLKMKSLILIVVKETKDLQQFMEDIHSC